MDIIINEEDLARSTNGIRFLVEDLDELQQKINDAKTKVSTTSIDPSTISLGNISSEMDELYTVIKNINNYLGVNVQTNASVEPTFVPVYDSFYGVQNQPAYDALANFIGAIERGVVEKGVGRYDLEKTGKEGFSKPIQKYMEEEIENSNLSRKTKHAYGNSADKDYKFGKELRYDSIDIVKTQKSKDRDLYHYSDEMSGEYGTAGVSFRVATLDTNLGARVGPDHVILEASAVATGITTEAYYKTPALKVGELEMLSAGVSTEVNMLYAEAKAKGGVGIWKDDNGEIHTDIGLDAKAELDFVRAGVSADVTALGVTGKVTAGVKVGMGAQFEVGFVDGVFKCNLSAAIGLGVDIGFSLKFDNLGKVLTEKSKVYLNALANTKTGQAINDFIGDTKEKIYNSKAGQVTRDVINYVANTKAGKTAINAYNRFKSWWNSK